MSVEIINKQAFDKIEIYFSPTYALYICLQCQGNTYQMIMSVISYLLWYLQICGTCSIKERKSSFGI